MKICCNYCIFLYICTTVLRYAAYGFSSPISIKNKKWGCFELFDYSSGAHHDFCIKKEVLTMHAQVANFSICSPQALNVCLLSLSIKNSDNEKYNHNNWMCWLLINMVLTFTMFILLHTSLHKIYSYMTLSRHLHLHNLVHFKSAELHLHLLLLVHDVWQPHFTNSLHSIRASNWDIQFGIHLITWSLLSNHPKSFGDGKFCWASRHLLQTQLW